MRNHILGIEIYGSITINIMSNDSIEEHVNWAKKREKGRKKGIRVVIFQVHRGKV